MTSGRSRSTGRMQRRDVQVVAEAGRALVMPSCGHSRLARFVTGSAPPSGSSQPCRRRARRARRAARARARAPPATAACRPSRRAAPDRVERSAALPRGAHRGRRDARRSPRRSSRRPRIDRRAQDRRRRSTPKNRTSATSSGPRPVRLLVGRRAASRTDSSRSRSAASSRATRSSSVVGESAADVAGVAQAAVRLAARRAAARRTRPRAPRGSVKPPIDERVALDQLQLAPLARAPPGPVRRVRVLDDQPFPPARARLREQRRAVAAHLRRQADDVAQRGRERRLQAAAALDERQRAQIRVPVAQQIERDERDRVGRRARARSRARPVR